MRGHGIQYLNKELRKWPEQFTHSDNGDIECVGVYVDILADIKSMWKFFPEFFFSIE